LDTQRRHNIAKKQPGRQKWIVLAILFSVAAVLAFDYYVRIGRPNLAERMELHYQILQRSAESPYRYRVLIPFCAEVPIKAFALFMRHFKAFLLTYALYDLGAIFALLLLIYLFLTQWFPREHALIGALFVAATMPLALRFHHFQPWSFLEAALFSLALLLIYQKRHWLLWIVVLVAALNRETAVYIPLVFLFISIDLMGIFKKQARIDRGVLFLFALYFASWLLIFAGLRYVMGAAPHAFTIKTLWAQNIKPISLFRTVVSNGLFLGFFWLFAALGFRHAPRFIQNAAFIVPIHFVLVVIYGVWYETRLLMSLYPILIGLGLSYIYHQADTEKPGGA
jgi:hypothetical protein